jgi:iron complex outermembrane receptor protein
VTFQNASITTFRQGCSSLALVVALAIGSPARAQTQAAPPSATPQGAAAPLPAPPSPDAATPADQAAVPDSSAQDATAPADAPDIVVTGFRASLNSALNQKRRETAAIDTIVAEDIGKFPDANLAESMQRVPGVALARGDGGEGKNISVRGLGAAFTRVRINGMEGTSQTGSSDIYGAGAAGRSFDFNVFPSEIFSSLAVRKTPSADIEEGSLGATVDLKAPHPLDYKDDFVLTATGRGIYNELSKEVDPRVSVLVSKKLGSSFGVLGSFAYNKRHIREVGYSAVNILPTYSNGGFCSPVGVTPQNPATSTLKGTDALNCSTGNPRTGSVAAYNLIQSLTGVSGRPGGGVFLPRIPRYLNSEQTYDRMGGTLSLQWSPDENTDISLDGLFSRFNVVRHDNYIDAISFARPIGNNGQPMTSVKDIQVDSNGSLQYGLFDGVDLRSESLRDKFRSTFKQANLNFKHRFSDSFAIDGLVGRSESIFSNPERLTVNLDAIDTPNFSIDYRDGGTLPVLKYGIDLTDASKFSYAPQRADGTVLGNYNDRNLRVTTKNQTYELNAAYSPVSNFTIKTGGQYRESDFRTRNLNIIPSQQVTGSLAAGTTVTDIVRTINGVDKLLQISGIQGSFIGVDHDKWKQAVGFDSFQFCGTECGAAAGRVRERITSGYLMAQFDTQDMLPIPIRGDAGVRYVHTNQFTVSYIPTAAPTGSLYPTVGLAATVDRSYEDWLPSANIVFELQPSILARFSASSVMSRPELGSLTASANVQPVTRTATSGNPFLDPIRATTLDAALEWYFARGSLLSVAYFHKNISSFIQSFTTDIPYSETGLPTSLLTAPTGGAPLATASDIFTVTRVTNTPGGPLNGVEVNLQAPFSFLPGFLRNFGLLANYTHVTSKIEYVLASRGGVTTQSTVNDLTGLSKNAASGTLYYEDNAFSIRSTASYRGGYLRSVPSGGTDSDVLGNKSTLYVDASASYNINANIKLIVEAQNLTDEHNTLYIDSTRQDTLFDTRVGRTVSVGANIRF